jgi:ubiquitin carboxyl-terminal hydrolase 12/46
MKIKSVPDVLVLHLKRFKYMEQRNALVKVCHRVSFPFELRLVNTVDPDSDDDGNGDCDVRDTTTTHATDEKKSSNRPVLPKQIANCDRPYELFAVVIHIGGQMRFGHYISMVKQHDQWFLYDDDNVTRVPDDDIASVFGSMTSGKHQDGYLLFYEAVPEYTAPPRSTTVFEDETESQPDLSPRR